jgi:hypothetical protein
MPIQPKEMPLDQTRWQAWTAKGRAQDLQRSTMACKAAKWTAVSGLLAVVGIWSHLASFEVVVRFLVTAGAMGVMFQAFLAKHYAVAVLFGALALLFNPITPVFGFSGGWQIAAVAASVVPVVASLAWHNVRSAS